MRDSLVCSVPPLSLSESCTNAAGLSPIAAAYTTPLPLLLPFPLGGGLIRKAPFLPLWKALVGARSSIRVVEEGSRGKH